MVYARYEYESPQTATSRLIASKSKVAPLTPVTIPRLELMAAVIGLRLTQAIIRVLEVSMSIVKFYSDSCDVLWRIRGHGRDFWTFVANRVGEIQSSCDPGQWQHVLTDQNPADLVSQVVSTEELQANKLWWNGPDWLVKAENYWPRVDVSPQKDKKECTKSVLNLSRFTPVACDKNTKLEQEWRLSLTRYFSWM